MRAASPLLRTPPPRSDTASRISLKNFPGRRSSAIRQHDSFAETALHFLERAQCGQALGPDRSRSSFSSIVVGARFPDTAPPADDVPCERIAAGSTSSCSARRTTGHGTRYIDAAVAQLRAEGHEIREEDIARLSPLKHRNLNLLGRYSFTASAPPAARPGRAGTGRGRRRAGVSVSASPDRRGAAG
ncbi:Tn3 family transposase [Nonomuraea sp. NPDC000554]|uniref:Tn3 family transposase n=1 Tax=Nonomuraea sp. NPDC000554 TaxID=3154259 RepID=UPI003324C43F